MNAYNYAAQRWVDGDEARAELIKQLQQELTILRSDRAESFLRFTGRRETVAEAQALCVKALNEISPKGWLVVEV